MLKQQDKLDRAQEKERTGANLVKIAELNQAVQLAKLQFQKEHLFLMEELPKLYNSRIEYIRPCVNSLIQSQSNFYDNYATFYESILNCNDANTNEIMSNLNKSGNRTSIHPTLVDLSSSVSTQSSNNSLSNNNIEIDKIDEEIQKCLNDIKSLSIVAGD